jgi:hypothetical protein
MKRLAYVVAAAVLGMAATMFVATEAVAAPQQRTIAAGSPLFAGTLP